MATGILFRVNDFGTAEKLEVKMNQAAEAALDNRIPLAEVTADIFRIEAAVFSSQGRRGGGSWKQLKPDTIKRKKSAQILVDTGALRSSLTEPGAPFQILDINNESLIFGTERAWAASHQTGAPSANIPARPFIRFTPNDISRWTEMISRHLMRPFTK